MLFSSGNGRYYFTVRDGWGVEYNCLYALSIGAIRRDFKKPVTIEEIESGVNNPKESKSAYSALAIKMKLKDDTQKPLSPTVCFQKTRDMPKALF